VSGLIDPTMTVLVHALNGLSSRQAAISSNLANIDTPGYTAMSVDFESALASEVAGLWSSQGSPLAPSNGVAADVAMERTDPRHLSKSGMASDALAARTSTVSETLRNDGNQVDLETEMTALTETQLKYEANSRLISGKFGQLYDVLGGR
jgi:flagellar basal-body rod protein FlgB